ncbi:MAG TPA: hypothetical protein VD886_03145, partial [Herpetosiphonaceae bacterium]|nr:hypothetical protein [Herpetosiphonaceae bacterium]
MPSTPWNLPAGPQVLGRVINPAGDVLDDGGPLPAPVPAAGAPAAGALFETGIKVLDVFAPLRHGAAIGLSSPAGVGKLVVMSELVQRLASRYNGAAVLVGSEANALEVNDMMRMMREAGVDHRVAMVFARADDDPAVRGQAVAAGWSLARDLAAGAPALLFIERQLAEEQPVEPPATANTVTVVYFEHLEDDQIPARDWPGLPLDAQIVLSRDLASQKIWPAIDPRHSWSQMAESGELGAEHVALLRQAREIMA